MQIASVGSLYSKDLSAYLLQCLYNTPVVNACASKLNANADNTILKKLPAFIALLLKYKACPASHTKGTSGKLCNGGCATAMLR